MSQMGVSLSLLLILRFNKQRKRERESCTEVLLLFLIAFYLLSLSVFSLLYKSLLSLPLPDSP